jgi:hypothetical protein
MIGPGRAEIRIMDADEHRAASAALSLFCPDDDSFSPIEGLA